VTLQVSVGWLVGRKVEMLVARLGYKNLKLLSLGGWNWLVDYVTSALLVGGGTGILLILQEFVVGL
jgi:hypothetical protein